MSVLFKSSRAFLKEITKIRPASASSSRSYSKKKKHQQKLDDPCPNETCGKKAKRKRSFWRLFCKKEKEEAPCATKEQLDKCNNVKQTPPPVLCDPCATGGTSYPTCGSAYIIQKERTDQVCFAVEKKEKEDNIVKKIETHPELKDKLEDPMPPFRSAELRLIELSERKLHPLYKKYISMPPRPSIHAPEFKYKTLSGPIDAGDFPEHLKIDKSLFEKKNIFSDFKKVEPPVTLVARMLEMKKNARPTMEPKSDDTEKKEKKQCTMVGKDCSR